MTTLFSDGFEGGNFQNWSFVQAQDPNLGPGSAYNYVSTASSFGITAHSGQDVAQFSRPSTSSQLHAKVFKEWSNVGKHDQFGRVEDKLPDGGNPNGVYSAWYYLPKDYKANNGWVNIFQFKEDGYTNGQWHQDPSWWLNLGPSNAFGSTGSEPTLFVTNWGNNLNHYANFKPAVTKAPVGRWFEVKAELHENDRIDWYVDGHKFDTSRDSTWDVGRFYDQSNKWIWGVGHYQGMGKFWVDDAKVTTLGDTSSSTPTPTPAPTPTPTTPPTSTPTTTRTFTGTNSSEGLGGTTGIDKIDAKGGDDKIWGMGGSDLLTGGTGKDAFTFDTKLGTSNVDTITDFSVTDDTIGLNDVVFTKLQSGTLSSSNFVIGTKALDSKDYIIYNDQTGALSYDADGSGSAAAIQFAKVDAHLKMTAANFGVI